MPAFVKVADLVELPGDTGKVVTIGSQEVALFKVGEEVFAIDNECPHREGPLGDGYLEDDIVTCPFHAWQVNVRTGEVVYYPGLCTRIYPCKVDGSAVYIEV